MGDLKAKIMDRLDDVSIGEWFQLFNELVDECGDIAALENEMAQIGAAADPDSSLAEFCNKFGA